MSARGRINLYLIALCVLMLCSPVLAQHFYFAQMTDTHFREAENVARTAKVIDSINKLPMSIECVVITGDIMMNNILDDEIRKVGVDTLKPLKPPYHCVAGNHDILQGESATACADLFTTHFGPLASKAEYQGVVFLMVYTEPLRMGFELPGYDAIAWTEQALKEAGEKPVIIFTHAPAVDEFWGTALRPGWPEDNYRRWSSLIESHQNVKAVITGHNHRDELHWMGAVPQFVSPPVTLYSGRQATYRIYEYNDGRISYRTIYFR